MMLGIGKWEIEKETVKTVNERDFELVTLLVLESDLTFPGNKA